MDISCAFPTTLDTPDHVVLAEQLGYHRAWCYDTPQQSPDVWMTLALAAVRTERIGLGPGVLIPSLRHPMVNAAATSTLAALAPGRVAVAFGTGFTGRRAMGYGAIPWAFMQRYVNAYRGLLRGEVVEWEGARMQMLHPAGHAPSRPIDVPVLIGAIGPKGREIARQLGDGVFVSLSVDDEAKQFPWVALLMWGSVLDDGESPTSDRVKAAAGPGWALAYHAGYELGGRATVSEIPGGPDWLRVVERGEPAERHLAIHVEHCVGLNEADLAAWDAGGSAMVERVTVTGSADDVGKRLADYGVQGVTELVYQPAGPDVRRELERFMDAASALA
ncbi:MAG: LLM class flavin-dependent oxidoreductase [Ilumatobacteraceae bacterium]